MGAHDLGGEGFFENTFGREFGHQRAECPIVFFLFSFADEIAGGE